MKRPSTSALPTPKVRKQAPVDDHKVKFSATAGAAKTASTASSEPKSILKKPLRSPTSTASNDSKPKMKMSSAALLKANTKAASKTHLLPKGRPQPVAIAATRGDVTGGMGRKRRTRREESDEEMNSGDDSDSDNDGEDEKDSGDEESDEDDFEGMPAARAKKTSKKHTEENMAEAMSKILGSSLRKADASTPILARSRGAERKIEEEKLEAKARKAISNEKKRLANRDRVKPDYTGMEYEKKLRKVATRGVVQLFNAIKAQQKATDDLTENTRPITTNAKDKVANLTKASFLDLLKSGTKVATTTSTPATEAEECLKNVAKYNKYANAFIDLVQPEHIRSQAAEATRRWASGTAKSAVDGAVMGYKMNFCTSELRTTCSSAMLENFKAPYTATAIKLLEDAGVIMGGKINMDEFGMGSHNVYSIDGPARNPFGITARTQEETADLDTRSAGGSSGGSAAAVASNMCFAALGSDTGGSVRLPASYCGVVGFKPSYGRISRWGLVAYASSLDTVGTLTKTVDDAQAIYQIMAKEDSKDSTCLTERQRKTIAQTIKPIDLTMFKDQDVKEKPLLGVRVGIPQEFNVAELAPATKDLWRRGIQVLKDAGAVVIPVSLPNTKLAVGAYFTLGTAEASSNLQRYDGIRYGHQSEKKDENDALYSHTRSEGFGKEVKRRILLGTYVLTSGSFDNFFLRAQKIRQMIRNDFDRVFSRQNAITGSCGDNLEDPENDITRVHALLTPVAVSTAPKLKDVIGDQIDPVDAFLDDIFTIPASLAGIPSMSVPFGTCTKDGFPMGLQVMSQYGDEDMVFKVARVIEEKGKVLCSKKQVE
ncbi:Trimeric GatFAB AmidoTransferase(AdT) complex subunit [Linnemannia exigua]|uniref:Glutamyl-tRNA(Gln) amidotransferase subunit A, mitochondrial n=1 Tax=Linnemannia exigua TaxID=604196 RepID=A0AAD4D3G5_9FUNG|nr:Trimeric GatFAB AmidoTransferase(AdT) complex subunit [Linnemannia exigua]